MEWPSENVLVNLTNSAVGLEDNTHLNAAAGRFAISGMMQHQ
jgi:hypothetical protein